MEQRNKVELSGCRHPGRMLGPRRNHNSGHNPSKSTDGTASAQESAKEWPEGWNLESDTAESCPVMEVSGGVKLGPKGIH